MLAFQVTNFSESPSWQPIPAPSPGTDELGVEIRSAGLNFADLLMAEGTYQETPQPPFTLGLEAAGVVVDLGTGVRGFNVGDHVAVLGNGGGLAEYGVFAGAGVSPLPQDMPFNVAAGFQIAYGTAHLALAGRANLRAGERLLVLGAAGGVGLTAVEIGKALGAEVIAVARGQDKLAIAEGAGADHLIDIAPEGALEGLRDSVRDLGGADVVFDPVGGEAFKGAFRACNPLARYLIIGFASGQLPQIPANHLLVKNVNVIGFYWGGYMKFRPDLLKTSLRDLFEMYEAGKLSPHISHVLARDTAARGLELLKTRRATGKVVVEISSAT